MCRRSPSGYLARFLIALVLGATVALGIAGAVPAANFDDSTPCPHTGEFGPALVCPDGEVGKPYALQLKAFGSCDLYIWSAPSGGLPAGLSLSSEGFISGTPTEAGTARFWVVARDRTPEEGGHEWCSNPKQTEREFVIRISGGLVVTTDAAPSAITGRPYALSLSVGVQSTPGQTTPPSTAPTWSVEGDLPPGLALNAETGVIAGTPTTDGIYAFVVRATLPDGRSAAKPLSIEVKAALAVVPPEEIPASEVGVLLRIQLGATGGTPAYTWSLASGALPEGVALTARGLIAGRPLLPGIFRFSVSVADTGGQIATYSGVLRVAARLSVARPVALRPGIVGRVYRARIVATGGVTPTTWTLVGRLPRGVRFDRSTATLSGTPRAAGRYRIVVQATDQLGVKSKRSYLLIVAAPKKR